MAFRAFTVSVTLLFRRMGILLVANVLWILLSLPLVTWPAATAALFYLTERVVREEAGHDARPARTSDYWTGFRQYWLQSTAMMVLNLAVLGVLAVALQYYATNEIEVFQWLTGPILLLLLAWLGAQLYLYPLLIAFPTLSVFHVARLAFLSAISYPLYTLMLLVLLLTVTAVCLVLLGPVLLLLFSLLAVAQTVALRSLRIRRGEIKPGPEEWRASGA